jgi:hypothetical protein
VQPQSQRVYYKRSDADIAGSGGDGDSSDSSEGEDNDSLPLERPPMPVRGNPVSMEADDSAGKDVYISDLLDDSGTNGDAGTYSQEDSDCEIPHWRHAARDGLDAFHDVEWLDF